MSLRDDHAADWWLSLQHGGQLLGRTQLDKLPEPEALQWNLGTALRAAVTAMPEDGPVTGAALTTLMDLLLEQVAGLRSGWLKGAAVSADYGETLLDKSRSKPRRIWQGLGDATLYVFTTTVQEVRRHKGRRPVAQVMEYLRRRGAPLALLTNGRQWRLIFADADTHAWVQWDTQDFFEAGQLSDSVRGFSRLLGRAALTRTGRDGRGPLLTQIAATRHGQARLSAELGERVRKAVEALLISRQTVLAASWDERESQAVYVAACHFIMRLVVTLFAEARGMLPLTNAIYHNGYGLNGLLASLDRTTAQRRKDQTSAWSRLLALFNLLYRGSAHPALTLTKYGGDLFRPGESAGDDVSQALALLESPRSPPTDEVIHQILSLLTRTTMRVRDGKVWRRVSEPVNFRDLSSEYIGILYEGLLDYELKRAGDDAVLFLNLGHQPALPMARLEEMDDKAIKALVEKVKDTAGLTIPDEPAAENEPAGANEPAETNEPAEATTNSTDDDSAALDDPREAALRRAMAWAMRAVRVGKLVKTGRGRDALEQQRRAADALINKKALKLPGEFYLVRWGGTRKGSGTFYTRPQLTQPTVRRTLRPLTHDDDQAKTPEAILALRVLDPAMGSASFLVAALRVMTTAVVEAVYAHDRVHGEGKRTRVEIKTFAASDKIFAFPPEDSRFRALLQRRIRRYIVEHCLYGVDINPLAVELARVSLWVETLDEKLPFTFLDHKLKAGNALVGCWFDRFREYPLLAWSRESPDNKYKGVHHPSGRWHRALAAKKKQVISAQAHLLQERATGQLTMALGGDEDEQARRDMETVRELFKKLRRIPTHQPARRARLYRERIEHDPAMDRLKMAFDMWTALWFWPLDQVDAAPGPRELRTPSAAATAIAAAMVRNPQRRFFHWELEYPDVFHKKDAGFDAVIGNPPWEIQKPNSKEYFSNHDPLYRSYGKQEALRKQRAIFAQEPSQELNWLAYLADYKARGNFVRSAGEPFGDGKVAGHDGANISLVRGKANEGLHKLWRSQRDRHLGFADKRHPFRHQGSADLNTYKMFVEAGYALLRPGGELGLIVPSGIYTDKGTGDLRRLLLEQSRWRWLFGFENRDKIFDIHRSFKFCVLIAQKGGQTQAIAAAFMRHDLEDWQRASGADYVLDYPAQQVKAFSPKSLSILEIRSRQDLAVLQKIYENGVLLGDPGPDGWGITYAREFDMTNDSKLFPPREQWEAKGYEADAYGRWIGPDGDVALPLYEGRMIGQFDFSEKGWVSGKGRTAVWREIPWAAKVVEPQYLMGEADYQVSRTTVGLTKLLFMDVTSATNRRTMVSAVVPSFPAGNKTPVLESKLQNLTALCAILNSFAYDSQLRVRLGGITLNYFIVEETALPRPTHALKTIGQISDRLIFSHVLFARVWLKQPGNRTVFSKWAITCAERLRVRIVLDAVVAMLFGLSRKDFAWILRDCDHPAARLANRAFTRDLDPKGFWRVDKDRPPELRHTVLSLIAFDALQVHIEAAGGDRDAGVEMFLADHDGDGWMLPDTLRLADHGLGHDERAQQAQPVATVLGPRFLDWQLAQTPAESWAACAQHAAALGATPEYNQLKTESYDAIKALAQTSESNKKEMERVMITELRIKNFKAWDERRWQAGIRLAQITMILGTNSSGKSSLLEPLRLMKQTLSSRDTRTQLTLSGPLDLGSFEELVHGRNEKGQLGIGITFIADSRRTSIDADFQLFSGVSGVSALKYSAQQRQVWVTRNPSSTAYRLSTPEANHPNWSGLDLADPKKNAREVFKPVRGFQLSPQAVSALGQPLRSSVIQGMRDLEDLMRNFHYLAPIRSVAEREIRWEQQERSVLGEHGEKAYQVLLAESRQKKEQRRILNGVSRWVKHMGLADSIEVKRIGRSLLYELRIVRGEDESNIVDVGMGLSQVLPVLVLLHFVPEGSVLLLDEPSVHLHALAQAKLADALVTVAKERNLQLLVETHSESLFRRLQFLMADEQLKPQDCALYYVNRESPAAALIELEVDEFGRVKNWPNYFFGDALGETERQIDRMFQRMAEKVNSNGS